MTVLLSIKPQFAFQIFDGSKKYEFRKTIFKRNDVRKAIVYVSSPIQQVIGEFEIEEIISDTIRKVWEKTSKFSGITQKLYKTYFGNKNMAYAIKIGRVQKYSSPRCLSDYDIRFAPQSFIYLAR
jgi:predicted transcriptional regulator